MCDLLPTRPANETRIVLATMPSARDQLQLMWRSRLVTKHVTDDALPGLTLA